MLCCARRTSVPKVPSSVLAFGTLTRRAGWTRIFVLVALVHGAQAPCPAGQYGDWDDGQSGASCNPATYKFQETDARRRSPSAYENAETTCKTACGALSDCVAISLQNSTVSGRRRRRYSTESAKTCHTCTVAPTPAPTNPTRRRRYGDCRRRYCGYGYGGTVDTRRRGYIVYTHPPCTACASGDRSRPLPRCTLSLARIAWCR